MGLGDVMVPKAYTIAEATAPPELSGSWDGPVWRSISVLAVDVYRPESGSHRPVTECKLCYDRDRLYGIFRVADCFIRCVHSGFQAAVYKDSCVEIFVEPKAGSGYFNFEFSCGGALLASYVTDPTRVAGRVKAFTSLAPEETGRIGIFHSLPAVVDPEITEPGVWTLEFSIPVSVLETYVGIIGDLPGQIWRANFYKCGDETSHPHWGAWAPVGALNFHRPADFGMLRFEGADTCGTGLRRTVNL